MRTLIVGHNKGIYLLTSYLERLKVSSSKITDHRVVRCCCTLGLFIMQYAGHVYLLHYDSQV